MACAPWEKIEQVLPYLDVYLMDIKHMNQEKHKEFTGRANGLMLENARKGCALRKNQTGDPRSGYSDIQ